MIKAKFTCNATVPDPRYKTKTVYFNAVYGTEGENADYSKYTPSAYLSMVISEETKAYDYFEIGKNYYLTFETV